MNRDYANRQIILHWLVVLAIMITYALAELKGFTPHNSRLHRLMVVTHYSAGFSVLILMLFRIYLRILHRAREILPSAPRWPLWVAKAAHGLLYLLFITVPLLGMWSLYLGQLPWSLFGVNMPHASHPDPALRHSLRYWHALLANSGYALIGLHAGAALVHHYLLRDNTLMKMLPQRRHTPPTQRG